MISVKLRTRPDSLSPYRRMCWQQVNCVDQIVGYAVGLATERTNRAAYMTGIGIEITNNEGTAAILSKTEASALMTKLHGSDAALTTEQYKIAFLVPVSSDLSLDLCTFSGF